MFQVLVTQTDILMHNISSERSGPSHTGHGSVQLSALGSSGLQPRNSASHTHCRDLRRRREFLVAPVSAALAISQKRACHGSCGSTAHARSAGVRACHPSITRACTPLRPRPRRARCGRHARTPSLRTTPVSSPKPPPTLCPTSSLLRTPKPTWPPAPQRQRRASLPSSPGTLRPRARPCDSPAKFDTRAPAKDTIRRCAPRRHQSHSPRRPRRPRCPRRGW